MPQFHTAQIPAPTNWDEFEDLCCDLWKRLWEDPDTQRNGRCGQSQHGVDVCGRSKDGPEGLQCKLKSPSKGSRLQIGEIRREAIRSDDFEPKLVRFTIATTTLRDAPLQEEVRLLSEKRKSEGKSIIAVSFWDDITQQLDERLLKKYYPTFFLINPQESILSASPAEVNEYLASFVEYFERQLRVWVEPSLTRGSCTATLAELTSEIQAGSLVVLRGSSGIGKSHLARRSALALIADDYLPIWAKAGFFQGDLDSFLDTSVGQFHRRCYKELIEGGRSFGRRPVLIVDGLNEAQSYRDNLLHLLGPIFHQKKFQILITDNLTDSIAENLCPSYFEVQKPDSDRREELFRAHGISESHIKPLADALHTPHDFYLASNIANETLGGSTAYHIFSAFTRKKLKDAPEAVELLRKLAAKLSESLTWSLPTAQATSLLTIENGPIAATHKAMTAGFLSETGTLLSFSHERFRDYFLAESILTHSSQQNLVAEICRPRNQEAGLFVINALTDPGLVRHCLYILKSPAILQAAYFGDLGPYPKAIIVADIKQLFIMAFKELTGLRIVPETPGKGLYPHYRVEGELAWSTDEVLLLATLSRLIRSGIYFDDFWTLLKATEERLVRTPDDTNRPKASRYRAALEVLVMSRGTCCLTHLLPNPDSAEWPKWQNFGDFWSWQGAARTQLQEKLPILGELTPLELYLVCKLTKDSADWSPDVATAVPEILRLSKRWSIYHLSLECLQLAEYTAHRMDPGPAQETAGVLESLLGNNPFFNSLVFSALAQYKTVETGITSEQVALQLTSILDKPRSEFTCMAAWNIFNAQFEDVFENTFTDAIQNLDPESAIEFRVRAALGSSNLDSSFISILALELLDSESQIAAPAFEKLCVPPVPVSFISDSLAETFILATLGLASLRHPLPERELAEDHSGERAAWLDWRDIIYWMNRTDLPKSERDGHLFFAWERLLAESLEAAVSSWYWIFRYQTSDFAHQRGRLRINDNFELQLKCLLEKGLFISYETLRLDPFLKRDIVLRMIRCLTCIGDTSTELILRTWVDSEAFGKAAIEAIRVIQERQHGKFT